MIHSGKKGRKKKKRKIWFWLPALSPEGGTGASCTHMRASPPFSNTPGLWPMGGRRGHLESSPVHSQVPLVTGQAVVLAPGAEDAANWQKRWWCPCRGATCGFWLFLDKTPCDQFALGGRSRAYHREGSCSWRLPSVQCTMTSPTRTWRVRPPTSLVSPTGTMWGAGWGRAPTAHGKDGPEQSGPECHQNLTFWPGKVQTQDPPEKRVTSSVTRAQVSAQAALLTSSYLQLLIPTVIISNDKIGMGNTLSPPWNEGHPPNTVLMRGRGVRSLLGQVFRGTWDFWK